MRKTFILFALALLGHLAYGETSVERVSEARGIASALASASATALAKADLALARSYVTPNAYKGNLGEGLVEKVFLNEHLLQSGNWQSITPRFGPQGLDHLWIKLDKNGLIRDILVGETKYNTSTLNRFTKDGVQMGDTWIRQRLQRLSQGYYGIAQKQGIGFGKPTLNSEKLEIVLKGGKQVCFWRAGGKEWNFSGTAMELDEARRLATQYGAYFDGAATGAVRYRTRVFNLVPKGKSMELRIYDAQKIVNGNMHAATPSTIIPLSEKVLSQGDASIKKEIAKILHRKLGLSDTESLNFAQRVVKECSRGSLIKGSHSLYGSIAVKSAMAGGAASVVDVAIQLGMTGTVDPRFLVVTIPSVGIGTAVAQTTHIGLTKLPGILAATRHQVIQRLSGPLRLSSSASSTISSTVGGAVTSLLFAYGSYWAGNIDLQTANRYAITGLAGVGAGALVSSGVMLAVGTWGTAGTGVAISTLSGAAATNASLAVLGGGTVATGGGGMALGTAVLGGVAIVAAIAATAAFTYCYKLYDENQDNKRIYLKLEAYRNGLDSVLRNDRRYGTLIP